jgi:hypothetical protein
MQDRPSHDELLAAIEEFLEQEILPSVDAARRFHTRVALNTLRIVRRELAHEDEQLRTELARLTRLLSAGDPAGDARLSLRACRHRVRELTDRLCDRIRAGDADAGPFRRATLEHVRRTVREKLETTNPRWLDGHARTV